MSLVIDKLYRYEDKYGRMFLHEHKIISFTPCGAWISVYGEKRFVLAGTRKKFACKTEEEAMESFLKRKERQIAILKARISAIEEAVVDLRLGNVQRLSWEWT